MVDIQRAHNNLISKYVTYNVSKLSAFQWRVVKNVQAITEKLRQAKGRKRHNIEITVNIGDGVKDTSLKTKDFKIVLEDEDLSSRTPTVT